MKEKLLFFIPHYVTEEVVCQYEEDGNLRPICNLSDVHPGEHFDRICVMRSVAWMWWGFFGSMDVPGRPFNR